MFLFRVRHCGAQPELDHGRADAVFDLIRSGNAPQQGDAGFAAGVGIRARIGMKPPLADYITHLQIWKERVAYYVLCQIGALVCLSHSGDGSLISTSPRGSRPVCSRGMIPCPDRACPRQIAPPAVRAGSPTLQGRRRGRVSRSETRGKRKWEHREPIPVLPVFPGPLYG